MEVIKDDGEIARRSDMIISLKYPTSQIIDTMKKGQVLVTMAHFHTRPGRVRTFIDKGIRVISMDSIVDRNKNRVVQDLKGVAWNGLKALFDFAEKNPQQYNLLKRKLLNVVILGTGGVGMHTINAARYLGDKTRKLRLGNTVPKVIVISIGSDVTNDKILLKELLKKADILVDASNRADPTTPIISNLQLEHLPKYAAIIDLATDYYDPFDSQERTMVKAIEGIPTGDGSKYIFLPNDLDYTESIPDDIPNKNRRLVFTHGSWPALDPEGSMETYGKQLFPLLAAMAGLNRHPKEAYDMLTNDHPSGQISTLFTGTLTNFIQNK